ncbi:hypothetical protein [Nostoc sp.]|uniref:hypothetical protein n=1 Tax=Nostoc sp. TaxID=1180 RepID=UPI002FF8C376
MNELADLLTDPKPEARVAAAKAIAYTGNPQGVPLLRFKTRIGDRNALYAIALTPNFSRIV